MYAKNAYISGTITGSTITGSTVNGGTVSGSAIRGGSIYISDSQGHYLSMGIDTDHPKVSGLNVDSGLKIAGMTFGTTNDTGGLGTLFYMDSGLSTYRVRTPGGVRTNLIDSRVGNPINILSGGASGSASGGGVLIRTGGGHITLDAANGDGNVYASGVGAANSKVLTNNGQASSKNTKVNITGFTNQDYTDALKLLQDIGIYSYDYKYDLYNNRHQFGFIIDEVELKDKYDKFFDFYSEDAKVLGDHLDFSLTEEGDGEIITVKRYNSDTLDKFMLTCIKALQYKVNLLEEQIKKEKTN